MSCSPLWNPLDGSGIIFDWDGVLAETDLDFSGIREKYFGGRRAAILEEMELMDDELKKHLSNEIREIELEGAARAVSVPGSREIVEFLEKRNVPWAVVSRNCPESIELAARTIGFRLPTHTFHRESGGPVKPSPEALWMAADAIGASPKNCTVVGDFVYDLLGARRAGMRAVLVERSSVEWEHWADVSYPKMTDFLAALTNGDSVVPWEYHSLVADRGLAWLTSAWKISVVLPNFLSEEVFEKVFALAGLGVGGFKVEAEKLTFREWLDTSWLSANDLERPKIDVLRRLLMVRYPKVSVAEGNDGTSWDSVGDDLVSAVERLLN